MRAMTMTSNTDDKTHFEIALAYALGNEGGWAPDDTGGPTNCGLLQADIDEYNQLVPDEPITTALKDLSRDQIETLYYILYYKKQLLHELVDTNVVTAVFDIGVNCGRPTAAKFLQRTINMLWSNAGLAVDGIIGPVTIDVTNKAVVAFGRDKIIRAFVTQDIARYEALVEHNPEKFKVDEAGWINRANKMLTLV